MINANIGMFRTVWTLLVLLLLLLGSSGAAPITSSLHTHGIDIVDKDGRAVQLRGVNLGGWMVTEEWMTTMESSTLSDEHKVMAALDGTFGVLDEQRLIRDYRRAWITADDLDNIKARGLNVVRVPVWWGDFYTLGCQWRNDAFELLDCLVKEASARGIYTIIDMHGVFGGQSDSANTGYADRNKYWTCKRDQDLTAEMWEKIATHFEGNPGVAGYDLINEPMGAPSTDAVWSALDRLYRTVRRVDPDHMIFMETAFGKFNWDMLPNPAAQEWTNVVYETHVYHNETWCDTNLTRSLADGQVADFNAHKSWNVPAYVGEFNAYNGTDIWQYVVDDFNRDHISWSMWSYKATAGPATNSWGLYDIQQNYLNVPKPDIKPGTREDIAKAWKAWTTKNRFETNSMLSPVTGSSSQEERKQ
jgi:endoglucanase